MLRVRTPVGSARPNSLRSGNYPIGSESVDYLDETLQVLTKELLIRTLALVRTSLLPV